MVHRILREGDYVIGFQYPEKVLALLLVKLQNRILVTVMQDEELRADVRRPAIHQTGYGILVYVEIHIAHGHILAVHVRQSSNTTISLGVDFAGTVYRVFNVLR